MKVNYLLKSSLAALCIFAATTAGAKDIYVSNNGNDANDGTTEATALRSMDAAVASATDGDDIKVIGMLTLSDAISITGFNDLKVSGIAVGNTKAGFDAGDAFTILSVVVPQDGIVVFRNLDFIRGYSEGNGGGVLVGNGGVAVEVGCGRAHFSNCGIYESFAFDNGGGFFIEGDAEATFYNCVVAYNSCESRGAGGFTAGNAKLTMEYCNINQNTNTEYNGGRGAGLFLESSGSAYFYKTMISNNTSGDPTYLDDRGGAGITTGGDAPRAITFECCAITENVSYGRHGSAMFLMGNPQITMINSTIAKNFHPEGAGSTFCDTGVEASITFVNTTYAGNTTNDNAGNSAGLRLMNGGTGPKTNIYNSLFVGNVYHVDNPEASASADVCLNTNFPVTIKNSVIGAFSGDGSGNLGACLTITDNEDIDSETMAPEYEFTEMLWMDMDQSGVNFIEGMQTSLRGIGFYSLTGASAYAATLGDRALLNTEADSNEDLFSNDRGSALTVWAGAVQGLTGKVLPKIDDRAIPVDPLNPDEDGSEDHSVTKTNDEVTFSSLVDSNGLLWVNYGSLDGKAKGELYSIDGRLAKVVFDCFVVGTGVYDMANTPAGSYILKVTVKGKTFSKPLIVK